MKSNEVLSTHLDFSHFKLLNNSIFLFHVNFLKSHSMNFVNNVHIVCASLPVGEGHPLDRGDGDVGREQQEEGDHQEGKIC